MVNCRACVIKYGSEYSIDSTGVLKCIENSDIKVVTIRLAWTRSYSTLGLLSERFIQDSSIRMAKNIGKTELQPSYSVDPPNNPARKLNRCI